MDSIYRSILSCNFIVFYSRTHKEFFMQPFQFIERCISKDRYFHTWIIIEDTWWKTLSWGYKNESWIFHGLQPIFYLFYKIPHSVSIAGTHVFIAETCNKNINITATEISYKRSNYIRKTCRICKKFWLQVSLLEALIYEYFK